MRRTGLAALAALALAACGGSGDQTSAAAKCLRNALANQTIGGGHNCANSTASQAIATVTGNVNVTCTHKQANEYICNATGPGTKASGGTVQGGFYDVTFDGKSIVYQAAGG